MSYQQSSFIWLALAVLVVGIFSLALLGIEPEVNSRARNQNAASVVLAADAAPPGQGITPTATPLPTIPIIALAAETPTATPTIMPTPLPPLTLPEIPIPTGGQVYILTPSDLNVVGWVQADDPDAVNHWGDYNIYAGVFGEKARIGGIQFDLAEIPPGSPIIHADLTLTGLSSAWLGSDGVWTAQMLAGWMDEGWSERNFHWLARADSGRTLLNPPVAPADLGVGRTNTFFVPPEGLPLLEARLFSGKVSFRITGPNTGIDNLFAWDSGFGVQSLGRAPVLRIIAGPAPAVPPPTPTPDYVIITPASDVNGLLALAAERLTATAQATPGVDAGTPLPTATPTPLPPNWVTPVIVVNTPVPENQATAIWLFQVATAQALVYGTPTPLPPNIWTSTPTPLPTATPTLTPTPMTVDFNSLTPTATPTVTPETLPAILYGKILFYSDRFGGEQLMVMDGNGGNVALWTGGEPQWIYARARINEDYSPDRRYRAVVSREQIDNLQIWALDLQNNRRQQLTRFREVAYDPVWSPTTNRIAFVSPESGNDEIYLINADGNGLTQLTFNQWEWDKHPSWSPDGGQIAFWSNRETQRKQIWIINADGSNVRNLSNSPYNDWDPIWVK